MNTSEVIALLDRDSDSVASVNSRDNDSVTSFSSECLQLLGQENDQHLEELQGTSSPENVVSEMMNRFSFLHSYR